MRHVRYHIREGNAVRKSTRWGITGLVLMVLSYLSFKHADELEMEGQ